MRIESIREVARYFVSFSGKDFELRVITTYLKSRISL